jgi:hypothetical protein
VKFIFVYVNANTHFTENKHIYISINLTAWKGNEFRSWECHMFSRLCFVQRCIQHNVHLVFAHIFHMHANFFVHYKTQWSTVCCCPYLQNSLLDGTSTVQTVTALQWNTTSFRHIFFFYLCKTIFVSTPINEIILCKVHIYNISWHITHIYIYVFIYNGLDWFDFQVM